MKKISILLSLTLVFFYSSLNAQITKGSFLVGGNIGVGLQKTETPTDSASYEQKGFSVSPVFGKVIKENLVFGVDAGISFYDAKQNEIFTQKQDSYTGGIFLRQYKPIGKGFYLFLQERLGYRFEKYNYKRENNTNNYKRHTVSLNAYPGISYAVGKKLHLETGLSNLFYLNYSHEKGDNNSSKYKSNSFNAGVDFNGFSSLYVGFRFFLGK